MLTRKGLDWTARYKPIAVAAAALRARAAYIDGEVAVLDDKGVSDFGGLQEALSEGQAGWLTYFAVDLLHPDGEDLTSLPLLERKARLEQLIGGISDPIRYSEHVSARGSRVPPQRCKAGDRGVVRPLESPNGARTSGRASEGEPQVGPARSIGPRSNGEPLGS
jgi:bifunctional non-homologous end joining protein LigD